MKIEIQQKDLSNKISIALKAVSRKTNIQIHELIYFEAKNNSLSLTSSDGEISILTKVSCNVIEEGEMAINANIISNIVRKLPDELIKIEVDDAKIKITCNGSKFNILAFDYYEKKDLKVPDVDYLEIQNDKLKRSISQTEFATSMDETKLALTGILFELMDGYMNFVALDGYRVALKKLKLSYPSSMDKSRLIIPRKSISEWTRIIDDEKITKIYKDDKDIIFESGDTTMYCKVIDKNYIDYTNIISDISTTSLVVDRQELINSLERAQLLNNTQRANLIKINIEDDKCLIESNSEIGDLKETIQVQKEGEDVKIAFNARYLIEGVKACDTKSIKMNLKSSLNPCLIYPNESKYEDEEFTYLALPVRLAE